MVAQWPVVRADHRNNACDATVKRPIIMNSEKEAPIFLEQANFVPRFGNIFSTSREAADSTRMRSVAGPQINTT